jgi:hypothetical protein
MATREADRWFTILARFLEQFADAAVPADRKVRIGFTRNSRGRITNVDVTVSVEPGRIEVRAHPLKATVAGGEAEPGASGRAADRNRSPPGLNAAKGAD